MLHVIGNIVVLFSVILLPPVVVGWIFSEPNNAPFLITFFVCLLLGLGLRFGTRKRNNLRLRDGFVVVTFLWLTLSLLGALPFYLSSHETSFIDAWFEAMSGLTTTGATIYTGLDHFPHALLFYRHILQWFGGLGIVVLAITILPMLGVGGLQLYRIETTGLSGDDKLTPRLAETGKTLWLIYTVLTAVCAVSYYFAGMSWFDAICHSLSTIAIGGFSTHDMSIGYFNNQAIEMVAIVFMLIASINYSLHFLAWHRRHFNTYNDTETKVFCVLITFAIVSTIVFLTVSNQYDFGDAFRLGLFQAVSIATTTGFTTTNFSTWGGGLPLFLICLSAIGCCAGSTGGGIKVIRFWLLIKQIQRELFLLIHPYAQRPIKVGQKPVADKVLNGVWGFFSSYVIILAIGTLLLLSSGLDATSAFSAVAASLNNLGPGLGEVAANYSTISDASKGILCFVMLLGRLEIFTLLVVLTPALWKQ